MIICDKLQWRSMLLHVTGCLMVTSMGVAVFANHSTKFADYCPFIVVCSAVTLFPLILGFLGYIFARNEYLLLGVVGTSMSECAFEGRVLCFSIVVGAAAWIQLKATPRGSQKGLNGRRHEIDSDSVNFCL